MKNQLTVLLIVFISCCFFVVHAQVTETIGQTGTSNPYVAFRANNANTRTILRVIPNGSVTSAPAALEFFGTDFQNDNANYERLQILAQGSGNDSYIIRTHHAGTGDLRALQLTTGTTNKGLVIHPNGNIGVNIAPANISAIYQFAVDGKAIFEEVDIQLSNSNGTWPDYVFAPTYPLRPLHEVEAFIQQHQHLPDIPSAAEVEKKGSVSVGEIQLKLLQKIEELTLYMIDLEKKYESLKAENHQIKADNAELKNILNSYTN